MSDAETTQQDQDKAAAEARRRRALRAALAAEAGYILSMRAG
jgi:hypothetical protein